MPARCERFIPARAGNRIPPRPSWSPSTVHPRACGEQSSATGTTPAQTGSSPRVRGTGRVGLLGLLGDRFIPARAGNSEPPSHPSSRQTVHPRACGEQRASIASIIASDGSSPRVRGTGVDGRAQATVSRFIPARAGNRSSAVGSRSVPTVHPRACGEQAGIRSTQTGSFGSSPRVRGTVPQGERVQHPDRFIPARAGNSLVLVKIICEGAVHPRACGEQHLTPEQVRAYRGSSPRVRGTVNAHRRHIRPLRFIPARAGNSGHPWGTACRRAVHPRACGEQTYAGRPGRPPGFGSSPRVRGTGLDHQGETPVACSGSSPRVRGTGF